MYQLISAGSTELGRQEKAALVQVLSDAVNGDSPFKLRTVMEDFCSEFALYVEGKRDRLLVPVWELTTAEEMGEDG